MMIDLQKPSDTDSIETVLKWMIGVMDRDDKSLAFIASVFSYAMKNGAVSEKQADAAGRVYDKVVAQFDAGHLAVQGWVSDEADENANVTSLFGRRKAQ